MARRTLIVAAAVVGLAAAGVWIWRASTPSAPSEASASPRPATAPAQPSKPSPPPAATPAPAPSVAKLAKIREARQRRLPDEDARETEACTEDCWGTLGMQVELAEAVSGCMADLPTDADGTLRFSARVIAEPSVGAAIESVEVLDNLEGAEAFVECISESALLAELAGSDAPINDEFVFRYSTGTPKDASVEFLNAHDELLSTYPELAAVINGTGTAAERATTFATVVSEHDDARAAFSEWVAEQGIDLSGVKVE